VSTASSFRRSGNAFSKHSRSPNATTTPTIATWSLQMATRCGYVSSTARRARWTLAPRAGSAPLCQAIPGSGVRRSGGLPAPAPGGRPSTRCLPRGAVEASLQGSSGRTSTGAAHT
jgi:hypothetical protein